ncbi:MAG: DUF2284 domain-containing protein [Deltaproteobacteria bacterium]|nr:DUF2284 domain-containing protein [Deltaproteobacteria bacterium]
MSRKVDKIAVDMQAGRLAQDLERYVRKALELGATRAAVIKAEDIPVDERITLKCQIPRCFGYGVGAHCPPNTLKPAELRDLLKKYSWAVLFTLDVPPEVIVRDRATIKERVAAYQQVFQLVSDVESLAFYDGHYLAFGFGLRGRLLPPHLLRRTGVMSGHGRQTLPGLAALPALHGGRGYRRLSARRPPGLGYLSHRQQRQTRRHAQGRPGRHHHRAVGATRWVALLPRQRSTGSPIWGKIQCKNRS